MYTLDILPAGFEEPSVGPFGVKAMCLLKLANQEFQPLPSPNPGPAPLGKFPVLRSGSLVIPDSDNIRDHLEQTHGIDFDAGLSADQRALSRALIRMVEEHVYFAVVCNRWMVYENYALTAGSLMPHLLPGVRFFLPGLIGRSITKAMKAQGMGRFTDAERAARIEKDIDALDQVLGEQEFLFGAEPSAADASVVAMLSPMVNFPRETPLSALIKARPQLEAYIARARAALYP